MSALDGENAIVSAVIESDASCRSFSLAEIQSATNNFDDIFVIGIGGFGKVFKGFFTNDDEPTVVAVKRLNTESKQGATEFSAEIKMLSKLKHTNLVALIGYCNDCDEKILVYEYIARGTLADHLYKRSQGENSASSSSPLSWEQRLEICVGAARGLDYIHAGTGQSFIHRDVKTTNILLDENWVVKISDFGLSKGTASHSVTHVTTEVKGSFGYFDPEYFFTHRLTTKSDVYAFGVVLLEVLCGRPPVDKRLEEEQISLVNWAQQCIKKGKLNGVIDPSLIGQISPGCLKYFVKVANNCLQKDRKARPTMAEVVESLQLALASQHKGRKEGIITKVFQGIMLVPKVKDRWLREGKDDDGSTSRPTNDFPSESHPNSATQLVQERKDDDFSASGPTKDLPPESHPDSAALFSHPFSLADIRAATNDFHKDLVIEQGWLGMVYKGYVDRGTRVVCIKRLLNQTFRAKVFNAEVELQSTLCHPNIASLIGFCNEERELILVYDYMVNGSLRDHLDQTDSNPIPWKKRLKICIDAARGLRYLHASSHEKHTIIHGDIKSSNILLDGNWVAKVANFMMSKIGNSSSNIFEDGDPEFMLYGQGATLQSDVQSFGWVLFKVLSPKKYHVFSHQAIAKDGAAHIDPYLIDQIAPDCLTEFINAASSCMQQFRLDDVVESLENALKLQEAWEESIKIGTNQGSKLEYRNM